MRLLHSTLLAFIVAAPCFAQPIPAILQSATSPSGQYSLRVTAPLGDPPPKGNGWVAMVYTLTDTRTGKTVWTRRQAASREKGHPLAMWQEQPARDLFVADDATVLALVNNGELVDIKYPVGAGPTSPPLDGLFVGGEGRNKSLNWNQGFGRAVFFEAPAADASGRPRQCFVLRAYWGEHLIFDAHSCQLLACEHPPLSNESLPVVPAAESERILQLVLKQEKDLCRSTLAAAATALPPMADRARKRELELALTIASFQMLDDTIPAIRMIEKAAAKFSARPSPEEWLKRHNEQEAAQSALIAKMKSASFSVDQMMSGLLENAKHATDHQWSSLVPATHNALRQLGEVPHIGVGVQVFGAMEELAPGSRDAMLAANLLPTEERLKGLGFAKPGVTFGDVIDALGCPDGRLPTIDRNEIYLYHFDTPEPFTLRIAVQSENQRVIKSVEEIRPPLWRQGTFKRTVINR